LLLLGLAVVLAGCLTPAGGERRSNGSSAIPRSDGRERAPALPGEGDTVVIPEEKKVYHTVLEGETLWRIAKAYGIDQDEIVKANRMTGTTVEIGQKLYMPGAAGIVDVEKYRPPRQGKKYEPDESFDYPCVGRIALGFGQWRGGQRTEGAEFSVSSGARVVASRTGEVVLAAKTFPGFGVVVILQHGPQYRTFYGYLAETPLMVGDAVAKGEVVGTAGREPRSGNSRLHFRIYEGTKAVDPLKHLR
jgi:lipoprotein NlpD